MPFHVLSPFTAGSPVLIDGSCDGVPFNHRVSCRTLGEGACRALFE
jgi:hypothetical protein